MLLVWPWPVLTFSVCFDQIRICLSIATPWSYIYTGYGIYKAQWMHWGYCITDVKRWFLYSLQFFKIIMLFLKCSMRKPILIYIVMVVFFITFTCSASFCFLIRCIRILLFSHIMQLYRSEIHIKYRYSMLTYISSVVSDEVFIVLYPGVYLIGDIAIRL